ncbi:hypothetical protein ACFOLJ_23750 [Rugamonas sp. CCM 8940]|uniref:hypothetical protein n=1 Tax=Rugamonas sp. CCM 8940 TaxID=2765359 RepID=UPI0018F5EF3F|nr:hypothetical protein [Rugamonas sp. CCM 8940]MBJ7313469.1 hypothetical protein [Rugamonas sp. CCM 8940]
MSLANAIAVLTMIVLIGLGLALWRFQRQCLTLSAQQSSTLLALQIQLTQQIDRHTSNQHAFNAAQLAAADALRADFLALGEQLSQHSLEQLAAALGEVIADFNQRIVAQFNLQLRTLSDMVAVNLDLHDKQRNEQMETMHHTRRLAEQVERGTQAFRELLADSTALAGIGAQLRQGLEIIGPRQEGLETAAQRQELALQQSAEALAQLRQQLSDFESQLAAQGKRALDQSGARAVQNGALQKEMNDNLNKSLAALGKQLATVQTKLSADMAPIGEQLRRVAELSKRK